MIQKNLKSILLLIVTVLLNYPTLAQTQSADAQAETNTEAKKLRVGIAGSEPFVFQESESGISLEIWDMIAEKKSWDYEYIPFENVDGALRALKDESLDIVVGPISITAKRLETMRFSQPFYNSSISILSRIENKGLWQKIKPLFSFKMLLAIGAFLIILAVVGLLFWLAERKKSPEQFSHKPLHGIGTGMWLAIVTMSTTGYGDKAPITLLGRIIAGSWMIISITFATSMVAGIASILTLANIDSTTVTNIEQLEGRRAATIAGSSSEDFLRKENAKVRTVKNLEEAITELENKNVDAVVFDRPQLMYYLTNNNKEELYISRAEYYKQGYGFAFALESQMTLEVNRTLLELEENLETVKIIRNYIEMDE